MFNIVQQTQTFSRWLAGLRDLRAKIAISRRIDRVQHGLMGDVKPVGEGVFEMRIDHGPGYRVYFMTQQGQILILLAGGDKSTQQADIQRAIKLSKEV
ncbi:type II toxin-antitoxin system RelE/ParE family toxin [Methylomonas rivi]|uniref:Type II toxin-antitoxin system RelE/ParE family toxin n=1 Tax=Methylomonas rivi TaxID=2952226 RepID=A0ABT1UAI4_9GAMM|nr:type II toxin-antitoxin system RelE/ParE family toxin [Methylomonas sp. WSC-6]MCQ8130825.1 type II toxin-antitoxin system RelE/ParE family toxin [Methylomonas sp. WSC-6]